MATAYTPGLKVTPSTVVRKTRRLPLKGKVTVGVGDVVNPDDVVAGTELPGIMQTVRVAEALGMDPSELTPLLKVSVGDTVQRGTVLAETKSFFGLFRNESKSPIDGTVELISPVSGHVGIRYKPTPVEVTAYIQGKVVEVIPDEGVVVETVGSLVQGIFGVGGERLGEIVVVATGPDDIIDADRITSELTGKVVLAGANVTGAALKRAAETGVAGIVVGGIVDTELIDYLGYDIGVAITGQESVATTLVVTEGFGVMRMADRTFDLLRSLAGQRASINGATQIRAGVIRPEVIVPSSVASSERPSEGEQSLEIGSRIRVIRTPYFGRLGRVIELPSEPVVVESGARVRVLSAELDGGERVLVPRANVEIIQGA